MSISYTGFVSYSDNEPSLYVSKPVVVYEVGTSNPQAVYEDAALTTPITDSRLRTGSDGRVEFFTDTVTSVDLVREIGGARTTIYGAYGSRPASDRPGDIFF